MDIERPPLWPSLKELVESFGNNVTAKTLQVDENDAESINSVAQQLRSPVKSWFP
jgi:hypothetical protein